jgi:hypothetical protein
MSVVFDESSGGGQCSRPALYSSEVQQPMRATAVLGERPHTRWAAPVDREQERAAGLHPEGQVRPPRGEPSHGGSLNRLTYDRLCFRQLLDKFLTSRRKHVALLCQIFVVPSTFFTWYLNKQPVLD